MSAVVQITLDTHAPRLGWGATSGTTAGELLRVAYTLDEPAVESAVLGLPDGRVLEVGVREDRLEILLPPDTPSGTATLTAVAIDDVDNLATYTLRLAVVGGVGPAPSPVGARAPHASWSPAPRVGPERQLLRPDPSVATARSLSTVTTRGTVTTVARASSRDRVIAPQRTWASTARASSTHRVHGAYGQVSVVTGVSGDASVVRRDGQQLEEALLLGLI